MALIKREILHRYFVANLQHNMLRCPQEIAEIAKSHF